MLVPVAAVLVLALVATVVVPRLLGGGDGSASVRLLGGSARLPLPAGQTVEPERSWSVEVPLSGRSSGLVREDRFVAVETSDDDDVSLVARSLNDGKEVWSDDLPGDGQLLDDDDDLVVQIFDDGSGSGELRSYDEGDGDLRWKAEVDGDALISANRHGDRLLREAADEVVAYRVDNGKEAWSETTSGAPYAVDGDRVFLTDGGGVRAVALDDGEEIWTTDVTGDVTALVFSADRVVIAAGEEIVGLAAGDGKEVWRADLGTGPVSNMNEGAVSGLNALADGTVVVVGLEDAVAIDPATGKERGDEFRVDHDDWQGIGFQLPGGDILMYDFESLTGAVLDGGDGKSRGRIDVQFETVVRGMLYDADEDAGELVAISLEDLDEVWKVEIVGITNAIAGDGLIVVQTADGYELWS
jgi:outer membrane protein assembly factor BamB